MKTPPPFAETRRAGKPPADAQPGGFRMLDLGEYRMRVLVREGVSDSPPLLLCNGLGQSIEILLPLIEEITDRPVIAFDAIGTGHSSAPFRPLTIPDHAVLVRRMLRHLGIATYHVLGISWGGCLAQQLAHDDPGGCRRVILAATSAGGLASWWGTPVALSEILFPLRYSSETYRDLVGPLMYGGEAMMRPSLFHDYASRGIAPSAAGYFGQVAAMCSWTSLGWLHRITQPTLVISGLWDGLIPAVNQMLLAERIPGARLKVVAAGHLLMYSRRKQIAPAIGAFLDAQAAREG